MSSSCLKQKYQNHTKTRTLTNFSPSKEPSKTETMNFKNKQKQKQFHLEEEHETYQAKCQLHCISQNDGFSIQHNKQFGGWADEEDNYVRGKIQERNSSRKIFKKTSLKIEKEQNINNTCILMGLKRRGRSKTQTACYSSLKQQKQNKFDISDDIKSMVRINLKSKVQKQAARKFSVNQVVRIIPQMIENYQNCTKNHKNDGQSERLKNLQKNKICHSLATTLIQIPYGGKDRKIKGSNFSKNNYQRNLYYRKVNNTLAMHKKLETEKDHQIKDSEEHQNLSGQANLNAILRRTFLNLQESRKAKQNMQQQKQSSVIAQRTPIQYELEKLKRLLKGQHSNYMQLSKNCPIKIHGLLSSNKNTTELPK